jgi:hypothetical protein
VDLRRERDIEQLRRIALARQVQIEQLLRVLQAKCEELEAFRGDPQELQRTLALVEELTKKQQAAAAASGAMLASGKWRKRLSLGKSRDRSSSPISSMSRACSSSASQIHICPCCKKLYDIEEELKDKTPGVKLGERHTRSRPVFDELVAWAKVHQPHEPPASPMGAGLRYLLNHQLALGRFLEDHLIPIDNGVVERLHVRAALTRKTSSLPDVTPAVSEPRSPSRSWAAARSPASTPSIT